jgi:hypothetical protein
MGGKILSQRALNRATLARQMLLERAKTPIRDAIRWLGGVQAQQSNDPYIALWSRIESFGQEDLTAAILDRSILRATTIRGTLHLHPVSDLVGFRALVQPFLSAQWKSNFLKRLGEEDEAKVIRAGIRLLDRGPMTAGALGRALKEQFPSAEPAALSSAIALHETLVQIPPTRLWGNGSAPILQRLENYLPEIPAPSLTRTDLVRRYLSAFGPASVNDMQVWCRLTRLSVSFEEIGDELIVLADGNGRTLYDLPDAPRPDEETPAPVRFLPLYDNVYLGYHDRRRLLGEGTARLGSMFEEFRPAVLVDGTISGGWSLQRNKGTATIHIELHRRMSRSDLDEVVAEGERFLTFLAPDAETRSVALAGQKGGKA